MDAGVLKEVIIMFYNKKLKEGKISFEVLYTTADKLDQLKPFARLLGPKGLFPNVKVGTLV